MEEATCWQPSQAQTYHAAGQGGLSTPSWEDTGLQLHTGRLPPLLLQDLVVPSTPFLGWYLQLGEASPPDGVRCNPS